MIIIKYILFSALVQYLVSITKCSNSNQLFDNNYFITNYYFYFYY